MLIEKNYNNYRAPGIALDVTNNIAYWADGNKILAANFDQANQRTLIITQNINNIEGLVLATTNRLLFIDSIASESVEDSIKTIQTNGTNLSTVLPINWSTDIIIDRSTNIIYWSDRGIGQINFAKYGSSSVYNFGTERLGCRGLALY